VTNAELAILSLVVERPRHGYDIEQTLIERNMRDWTEVGFSSIYYILTKLEDAGLVESHREPAPGRGPERRVYAATEAGRDALDRGALQAIAGPARLPTSFQLGLSTLPSLDPDEVATALATHARDLEAALEALDERSAGDLPFHVAAMFDLATAQVEAELAWIRRFSDDFDAHRRGEDES
jgi:DNA-binding PadR family transcriptional regulator